MMRIPFRKIEARKLVLSSIAVIVAAAFFLPVLSTTRAHRGRQEAQEFAVSMYTPTFDWTEVATSGPSARIGAAMFYDAARRAVLMFGGYDGQNVLNDLWQWNGAEWQELQPAAGTPSPRSGAAVAYDAAIRKTILFGGVGPFQSTPFGDTYEWDGQSWKFLSIPGPDPRYGAAMCYDNLHKRVILFGGRQGRMQDNVNQLADTWEFDGEAWRQVADVQNSPGYRSQCGMFFDPRRRLTVLVGGYGVSASGFAALSDSWGWDGSTWQRLADGAIPPRSGAVTAYNPDRQNAILFSGGTQTVADPFAPLVQRDSNAVLEWNGGQWRFRATADGPSPRENAQMAYDPARHDMVVFGGDTSGTTPILLGDTWTLSSNFNRPSLSSKTAFISGTTGQLTVSLARPSVTDETLVHLTTNSDLLSCMPTAVFAPGQVRISVPVKAAVVESEQTASLFVTSGRYTNELDVEILPAAIQSLAFSSKEAKGGDTVRVTVALDGVAGPHGAVVSLSGGGTLISAPSEVTVPAGRTSVSFDVTTSAVRSKQVASLTGTCGGESQTGSITLDP